MKKIMMMTVAMATTMAAMAELRVADATNEAQRAEIIKANKARFMERVNKRTGGKIERPGTQKGKILFVNSQKAAKTEWMLEAPKKLRPLEGYDFRVVDGAFTFPNVKFDGEAALFVIDDPAMPSLLHAPEQRWTMINIAPLKQGAGAKPVFFEARCRKEIMRGLALVCGTQKSNYPNSLLSAITKPEDLDEHVSDDLPVDIQMRFDEYLNGLGVRPKQMVPYITACKEGWAPAPTNENQKAIWEKVHQVPEKPLKIEFDPKAGK